MVSMITILFICARKLVTGDKNIANSFNHYFSPIACKLADNVQNSDIDPLSFVAPVDNTFHFRSIVYIEVLDETKHLKTKKLSGIDGIITKLLKGASDAVIEPLVSIFIMSLQTDIFTDVLKLARI